MKIKTLSVKCYENPFSCEEKIKTLLEEEVIDTKIVLDPAMMMQKKLHRDQM